MTNANITAQAYKQPQQTNKKDCLAREIDKWKRHNTDVTENY